MADASRFPDLAIPFTIVGAAAGWLSAGLIQNPLLGFPMSRPLTTAVAALLALLTGIVIKRLCVGRRYSYEIGDPDPDARPPTDRWIVHAVVVLLAGAICGVVIATVTPRYNSYVAACALSGALCAAVFVPVCLAVVAAARRAQRARHGSLVASADRRAVWGILALTLAVTTLEALPDWPASALGDAPAPLAVVAAVLAAGGATLVILRADRRALAEARAAIGAGLSADEPDAGDAEDPGVARVDLGLGDALSAQVARGAAAYRHRARTLSMVKGNPDRALAALDRAVRRGVVSLGVLAAMIAMHAAAETKVVLRGYAVERCSLWNERACTVARELGWERRQVDTYMEK
jgi:MFS family permease